MRVPLLIFVITLMFWAGHVVSTLIGARATDLVTERVVTVVLMFAAVGVIIAMQVRRGDA